MTTKPYKNGMYVAYWGCLECVEASRKQAKKTLIEMVRLSIETKKSR